MTDCKLWDKSIGSTGYGQIGREGKMWKAHRWVWTQANGPIPAGMFVDHNCHNEALKRGECEAGKCMHRQCVNLDHLRLVSSRDNFMAGAGNIDNKETCPKGHSYKDERNIMIRKSGKRECAECNRQRATANYLLSKVG